MRLGIRIFSVVKGGWDKVEEGGLVLKGFSEKF